MKKVVSLGLVLGFALLAGCGNNEATTETTKGTENPAAATQTEATDAKTSASIVNDNDAFVKAISKDGTWIIAALNDLTIDQDLVLDGQFENKGEPARKIALYAQDADHNVTDRYTLTAPKLTVNSENARIQGGTFKGDVYVTANGFQVVDATVDGNLYFSTQEQLDAFKMEDGAKVTGETAVKAE
ncbi:hypothetical protein QWJ34_00305 [Saccharibacillus sp. CPCC 101409]|uniref:hypothetical protein n=1 Tax=Saccharibacillus sp. CPCC 101409 TaxID=3058041 RepID=UPI002674168E|nr:hypothetical protein [Saccharibacillus sp. CPCC 101409]MDO3408198.1 hypothetical protein [Saccharibacillus sp. CPCC 101409]